MRASLVGRTLGKYELVGLLGYGAMAVVYKGYDRNLDRHVAIKVLPPHPGRQPRFVERFRLEARIIARLQHPHILPLYDYGAEDDILYLAMAYVEGASLRDVIRPDGLPLPNVEQVLWEIGSALDYAHRQGVIHCDIKPSNILRDRDGHSFLADFGIAKRLESDSMLTGSGGVVGTPAYMAPEQAQGETLDHRADIYSLGVTAYELLVGHPPYLDSSALRLIMKMTSDPIPSITRVRPDLPPELGVVMERALAKLPSERYQTVIDFCAAFNQAIHGNDFNDRAIPGPGVTPSTKISGIPSGVKTRFVPPIALEASSEEFAPDQQELTFLCTDIEHSTQLWERQPQEMSAALAFYNDALSQTVETYQGRIFRATGERVLASFEFADNALQAALTIQRLLHQAFVRAELPLLPLGVQMSLYLAEADERANVYFGAALNRASCLMNAARGGQILLSAATSERISMDTELRDLGFHRLPELNELEHIFQAIPVDSPPNFAPILSLTPRPTNLPAELSSFVGRGREIRETCRTMRQPNVRLLTLVGAGGIGKTRLSIQVGRELLDEYEDGVFFIPLAPLTRLEAIIKLVAQSLEIPEDASTPPLDTLRTYLHSRQVLLIFDNFEHVLDAAPLMNDLLRSAAGIKILTTSRESLFIYGEHTYTVPPLDLPDLNGDMNDLFRSSSGALFVERVQAIQPEFALSETDCQNVTNICRQLDGLPLALELAAARIRDLTLADIALQLSQRLALLNRGQRDLPARQQTIRGTIEWSYQLLSADDQRAFARLAVFEGQFSAQAAQAVTGIPDLSVFKNKSLVQQSSDEAFSMLAILREYARERLVELDELRAMRLLHCSYYCTWLETAENHLTGRDQIEWFERIHIEQYNLQAALEWSLEEDDIENAGRLAGILWRYWATQSLLSEGAQSIDRILAHSDRLSPLVHAKVTQGAGRLALLRSDYVRAVALQQTSLTWYQFVHDQFGQAAVLQSLGETEYVRGNLTQAENYLGEGLNIFRRLNREAEAGRCLNLIGKIMMRIGDFAKAEPLLHESLTLARTYGSSEAIALALYDLGGAFRAEQKYDEAEACYRESLTLYHELKMNVGVGTLLYNIGFTMAGRGNHSRAIDHFLEALTLLQSLDEPIAIAECLIGIAGTLLQVNQHDLGIHTLSAAKAAITALDAEGEIDVVDQAEYDRIYAAAQSADLEWQSAWAIGQSTPLEQIIERVFESAPLVVSLTQDSLI